MATPELKQLKRIELPARRDQDAKVGKRRIWDLKSRISNLKFQIPNFFLAFLTFASWRLGGSILFLPLPRGLPPPATER
jgi:hypothetical protein